MSRDFDLTLSEHLQESEFYMNLDGIHIAEKGDDLYPHATVYIDSVSQFLEAIKAINPLNEDNAYNPDIIYRGMSDSNYKLTPALARCNCDRHFDGYPEIEHYMVNEFLSLRPDAFTGLTSNFDLLSKMQHYGLPTRLLDFTMNPLMALFFACDGNQKKDGRVVCHEGYMERANEINIIEAICSSHKDILEPVYTVDYFISQNNISLFEYLHNVYRIRYDRKLLAKPKYWNERQQRQSSVFMIFPNELRDDESNIVSHEMINNIFNNNDFDEICNLSNYGCEFNEKGKNLFSNKFRFTSKIETIDKDMLRDYFCSIIIKSENKKLILNELAVLGIDKAFVYPELEYTAEKIKSKYM